MLQESRPQAFVAFIFVIRSGGEEGAIYILKRLIAIQRKLCKAPCIMCEKIYAMCVSASYV